MFTLTAFEPTDRVQARLFLFFFWIVYTNMFLNTTKFLCDLTFKVFSFLLINVLSFYHELFIYRYYYSKGAFRIVNFFVFGILISFQVLYEFYPYLGEPIFYCSEVILAMLLCLHGGGAIRNAAEDYANANPHLDLDRGLMYYKEFISLTVILTIVVLAAIMEPELIIHIIWPLRGYGLAQITGMTMAETKALIASVEEQDRILRNERLFYQAMRGEF